MDVMPSPCLLSAYSGGWASLSVLMNLPLDMGAKAEDTTPGVNY